MLNDMGSRMVTALFRFTRRSTIHGFNHIAQARTSQRRLFWLFISIFATIGFIINMINLLEKYWQVPILTNLYHDQEPFRFPDFTFCQMNPIYFPPNGTVERRELESTLRMALNEQVPISDYIYYTKNRNLTHPKWASIVYCRFKGIPCNESHFDLIPNFPYLSCYFFNMTKLNVSRVGSTSKSLSNPDLTMVVYQSLAFPKEYQKDPHNSLSLPAGIVLMVHEPGTFPHIGYNTLVMNGGIRLEIKLTEVNHLKSLGRCKEADEFFTYYNFLTNQNMTFLGRTNDCIHSKIQNLAGKKYNCSYMPTNTLPEFSSLPWCTTGMNETLSFDYCSIDPCRHLNIGKVIAHSKYPAVEQRYTHLNWLEKLSDMERLEEEHFGTSDLRYKALIDNESGNLSCNEAYRQSMTDSLNVKFVEQNFLMFKVVPFSHYMDIVVETEEYPLSRLLSDMGGCIGLWIGASLITFFECIDLILDILDSAKIRNIIDNDSSIDESRSIEQTLLKNHTAQTYILGGQPLWDTDSEVEWLKSKYLGIKNIPPTPPFYHETLKKSRFNRNYVCRECLEVKEDKPSHHMEEAPVKRPEIPIKQESVI